MPQQQQAQKKAWVPMEKSEWFKARQDEFLAGEAAKKELERRKEEEEKARAPPARCIKCPEYRPGEPVNLALRTGYPGGPSEWVKKPLCLDCLCYLYNKRPRPILPRTPIPDSQFLAAKSYDPTCLHESPLPLDHGHQPPSTAVNPGPGSQLAEGLMKVVWLELRHKSLGATLLRAFPSKSAADDKFWPLGKLEKGPFIPVASLWAERIHASLQSRWQRPCLFLCDGLGSLDWTDISKDPDALVAAAVQLAIIFELRWAAVRSEAHSEKESHDFSLFACVGDFGPGSRHLLQQNHILALPNPDPAFKVANANTIAAEVLQLSPSDLRPYLHNWAAPTLTGSRPILFYCCTASSTEISSFVIGILQMLRKSSSTGLCRVALIARHSQVKGLPEELRGPGLWQEGGWSLQCQSLLRTDGKQSWGYARNGPPATVPAKDDVAFAAWACSPLACVKSTPVFLESIYQASRIVGGGFRKRNVDDRPEPHAPLSMTRDFLALWSWSSQDAAKLHEASKSLKRQASPPKADTQPEAPAAKKR